MVIFPLAPDQTIAQMWSNGAQGVAYTDKVMRMAYMIRYTFRLCLYVLTCEMYRKHWYVHTLTFFARRSIQYCNNISASVH